MGERGQRLSLKMFASPSFTSTWLDRALLFFLTNLTIRPTDSYYRARGGGATIRDFPPYYNLESGVPQPHAHTLKVFIHKRLLTLRLLHHILPEVPETSSRIREFRQSRQISIFFKCRTLLMHSMSSSTTLRLIMQPVNNSCLKDPCAYF